jgi:hypothetical protein
VSGLLGQGQEVPEVTAVRILDAVLLGQSLGGVLTDGLQKTKSRTVRSRAIDHEQ